jgi:hypothetical protein
MADIANFASWKFRPNARYRIQLEDGTHVDAYFVSKNGDEELGIVWYNFNKKHPDDEGNNERIMIQNFEQMGDYRDGSLTASSVAPFMRYNRTNLRITSKPTLTENTNMGDISQVRALQSRTALDREADVAAATSYLALLNASRLPLKGLTTPDLLRKLDKGENLPTVDGQAPPSRRQLLTKYYANTRPHSRGSRPGSLFSKLDSESQERVMKCLKPKSGPKRPDQPVQGPSDCVLSGGTRKKRRRTKSRRR